MQHIYDLLKGRLRIAKIILYNEPRDRFTEGQVIFIPGPQEEQWVWTTADHSHSGAVVNV